MPEASRTPTDPTSGLTRDGSYDEQNKENYPTTPGQIGTPLWDNEQCSGTSHPRIGSGHPYRLMGDPNGPTSIDMHDI